MNVLVLAAGGLAGLAVAAAVAALLHRHPVLADALLALDERVPPSSDRPTAAGERVLLPALRRLPVAVPSADIELLGLDRDRFLLNAAGTATAYALSGPALLAVLTVMDVALPVAVPAGFTIVGLVVGWTSAARRVHERAERARDELRSALVSYLQQVGLLRRGGAGVSTALILPGRVLTGSWALQRLRDELDLAERSGELPWEGLRRFGERVDIDELADLSTIAATAGQDGGTVVDTLLARAEGLRDELLADEHAAAHRASGQMSTPGAVQVFLIAVWVLFPAGTALLGGV